MKTVKNYSEVKAELAKVLVELQMNFLSYDVDVYLTYDEKTQCGAIRYYGEFDVIRPSKDEMLITSVPGNVTKTDFEAYYHDDIDDICDVLGLTEDELYREVRKNSIDCDTDEDDTSFEDVWNFITNFDEYYLKLLTHWAKEVDLKGRMIEWATEALINMCDIEFED